ncbi:hypothetical protein AMECASPLE_034588, partial [Ameca splendens]
RAVSPIQILSRSVWKRSVRWKEFFFYTDSDITGSLLSGWSRLMRFILKVPEKFVPDFHVVIHGCGSQQDDRQNIVSHSNGPINFFDWERGRVKHRKTETGV